jgi:hypothetical protein
MEKGIPFAGSIIIDQILIRSMATNKEIDISGLFIEMDIFEDLFSNFLSAQIMLSDPYNIHSALPLVGEEEVLIKCKTPTFDSKRSFDLVFYAYKMTDKTLVEMKSTVYTLHLVPKEVIVDANVRISAAMGDSCSNLVRKILTEPIFLESQTPYAIEDSGNSIQYISNYWSPTQNMTWLVKKPAVHIEYYHLTLIGT